MLHSNRQEILDTTASTAGESWATLRLDELGAEGRAHGAWPGTLGEARGRVAMAIGVALRARGMWAVSHAELGRATRITYEAARRSWLHVSRASARPTG